MSVDILSFDILDAKTMRQCENTLYSWRFKFKSNIVYMVFITLVCP
jgi:hypothetical protein